MLAVTAPLAIAPEALRGEILKRGLRGRRGSGGADQGQQSIRHIDPRRSPPVDAGGGGSGGGSSPGHRRGRFLADQTGCRSCALCHLARRRLTAATKAFAGSTPLAIVIHGQPSIAPLGELKPIENIVCVQVVVFPDYTLQIYEEFGDSSGCASDRVERGPVKSCHCES